MAEVRERKFARPSEGERNADANKDNPELDVSKEKSARDVVTPLAQLSYDDQLEGKKASLEQMLKRLVRILVHIVLSLSLILILNHICSLGISWS